MTFGESSMSTYYRAFHKIYSKHEMQPWPQLNVIINKRINQTGMLLALTYADSFKSVSKSLANQQPSMLTRLTTDLQGFKFGPANGEFHQPNTSH